MFNDIRKDMLMSNNTRQDKKLPTIKRNKDAIKIRQIYIYIYIT